MGLVEIGQVRARYTSAGNFSSFVVVMKHAGLGETKDVVARDEDILEGKINNVVVAWERKWQRHLDREEKAKIAADKQRKAEDAIERTQRAQEEIKNAEYILRHTLAIDDAIDWEALKDKTKFKAKKLKQAPGVISYQPSSNEPFKIVEPPRNRKPGRMDFEKKIHWVRVLFGQKKKMQAEFEQKYLNALSTYEKMEKKRAQEIEVRSEILKQQRLEWEKEKNDFSASQKRQHDKVNSLREKYSQADEEAVLEHFEMVLEKSKYPDSFPQAFELQYNADTKMLLVDYELPSLENIPTLVSVTYVKSRDEFSEKHLNDSQCAKLFDTVVYQIALRTIHEIFEADVCETVGSVNFNGIVEALDRSTGHQKRSCIISIQAHREEFEIINLANVDPKQCFKNLKGVGSSKLASLTPIKPILELDKTDSRIVEHYEVANTLDQGTNIAAMDWQDFEHLIRELFEKEFATNGGEVKVTQASSDGGVDAIAFDPDPIRGGKIIIQAKRYTNTVGVSAVRDLYGTVMNEGATKGILVTTADFGPDSYSFARDKPITLLNGSNLLHLLEKHGQHGHIDVKAAKMMSK